MTLNATTFIDALHGLEQAHDLDTIAGLFAKDAEISNPMVAMEGEVGAAAFWRAYRSAFDQIKSSFLTILEQDGRIALEWRSTGSAKGHDVAYEGVSMLEIEGEEITAFRTYFDSVNLGLELTQKAAS